MSGHDVEPRFGSVVTAMVTPFDDAGALRADVAGELARWLTDHGSDALVVAGTTGEGSVLDSAECAKLWRAVTEAVTVPVIAGVGTNDTRHSIELARLAAGAGADALLVVTPYYSRPGQSGLFAHFGAVAAATELPVMLYDIPARTGRRISAETLLRLAGEVPNIVAVKDATGDPAGSARLAARVPAAFQVYCGDDALTLPLLSVGAVGVVSVAAHWVGEELGAMVSSFRKGDVEGARAINASLQDSFTFETSEAAPNPLPTKAVLRAMGFPVGQCRLPLGAAPPELDRAAADLLRGIPLRRPPELPSA